MNLTIWALDLKLNMNKKQENRIFIAKEMIEIKWKLDKKKVNYRP